MPESNQLLLGLGERKVYLNPKYANRHGLIAGATGTGKTVTLQMMAESFSRMGVPVFLADVKGDVSGISQPGKSHPKVEERFDKMAIENYQWVGAPTIFWDLFGKKGHPIRATVSDMGPVLLARLLDLNETQEGILTIAFTLADEQGLLLLDMKDLRSMLVHIAEHAKKLKTVYGNISAASVGAIQRRLLVIEREGGKKFFGEPMLELDDLIATNAAGQGYINVLAADTLMQNPRLYSTFLLWLLSELFENLPEVGDPEKPKFVFFFDEAHLLFNDAPKALLNKIEQVVRLIRSKGVGVYFITQSPTDIPDTVLAQLGNRVQHALRAFTPRDQKAVRAAADTFRPNPKFETREAIMNMGVGEALVSVLEAKGTPTVVERTLIKPPFSRIGPAKKSERDAVQADSPYGDKYNTSVDRHSAHEMLQKRAEQAMQEAEQQAAKAVQKKTKRRSSNRQSVGEAFLKSVTRSIGSQMGRSLMRGVLGSLFKGR
ncbi:MAG: helicase HerA-like C-terminal domain-containing protein [Pseudomonadales bacterium]